MPETMRPFEALAPEEKAKFELLETKTDQIMRLRGELAHFYMRYRRFLPKEGKRILRLQDIRAAVLEGKNLDELIAFPKDAKLIVRAEIRSAFRRASEAFEELDKLGGHWESRGELAEGEQEVKKYYKMRWGEWGKAIKEMDGYQKRAEELLAAKDEAVADPECLTDPSALGEASQELESQYQEVYQKIEQLQQTSPEAYYYAMGQAVSSFKDAYDKNARLIETPYVQTIIGHVQALLEQDRPVFIHGELGSGKTELAKHMSRTRLSKPHLKRWEAKNPKPADAAELKAWQMERAKQAEPLLVSGHRTLEIEQLLAARAIERKETTKPEAQLKTINEQWGAYRQREMERLQEAGLDEASRKAEVKKMETVDRELFEKAYLEMFRAPVETKTLVAPFLEAMKSGRPIVLDEINAIPHHTLIVLNDLLGRKPGEWVELPFPGLEPFQVQKGFAVLATGNYKPEDGLLYPGRQPLDAAFLSRFGIVSYDYLPMSRELEPSGLPPEELRKKRSEDELYWLVLARLLDKDMSLKLPEGSLEKIRKLCVAGRIIQDIFSEYDVPFMWKEGAKKVTPKSILKENVLSIRHLLLIVDMWKAQGFARDLDDYVYMEYVDRSSARPLEKTNLFQMLRTQADFFANASGETKWPDPNDENAVRRFHLSKEMYGKKLGTGLRQPVKGAAKLAYIPAKDVIEAMFGPPPKRAGVPEEYFRVETDEERLDKEKIKEFMRTAKDIAKMHDDVEGVPSPEQA